MVQPPGTVSKILWHFTGGPRWNNAKSRQGIGRKPATEAYRALLSILKSRELQIGGYKEVVKVHVPKLRQYNPIVRKVEERRNVFVRMFSAPVCCLSDIPVAHLSYHAARYGKIAIGFHREAAVRHGFNPVFYSLHDGRIVRNIRDGFAQLRRTELGSIDSIVDDIERSADEIGDESTDFDLGHSIREIRRQIETTDNAIDSARKSFRDFLAFVKTFARTDFSTIYCEREWRSTEPFSFSLDDVAMIVLPKSGAGSYFNQFLSKEVRNLKLLRSIPVVPWEDLIEH